ncbi:MAG: hypothetical protein SVY15_00710 [Halobacteriota archaeon]|nr:hypothetical protein [Halobacteriota archaeon]
MSKLDPLKLVLSVVDQEYPNDISVKEVIKDKGLFRSATKLAERNGLYYYFIYRLKELGVEIPSSEDERWDEENRRLSEFKRTIELLNKVAKDYGICYIIIKVSNATPYIPRDVDIFVRTEDRTRIIKALEDNGMKLEVSDVTETVLRKEGYIEVELYSTICYLGKDFIDGDFLWEFNVKDTLFEIDYSGLNKESNFLLMLIHRLMGHRSMSLLDFLHLKQFRDDINLEKCRKYAIENGWGSVFDMALNKLNEIQEKLYKKDDSVSFPYLYDWDFILKCVSEIDDLQMNKTMFYISLLQDGIVFKLKDSFIYNLLKSFKPARLIISFFTRNVRRMRGDVHG